MSLADNLSELYKSDQYPLHMPGHKRKDMGELSGAYHMDITEIEGYDNLYDAQGILREAMDFAGKMYDCPNTYYLVNGSTTGIITAIFAATVSGDAILIASNCHRSVKAATELRELRVSTINPESIAKDIDGGINVDELAAAFEKKGADNDLPKAFVITSPNYDGILSDIKSIADICHRYGTILIVDEAHGAHFSLDERLPVGALKCGADIVIHSTHKTLAAMTQTALLHVSGDLVDITKVEKYWKIFQTSSPSYILMASIDAALREIDEKGAEIWTSFLENKAGFVKRCEQLRALRLLKEADVSEKGTFMTLDPCKITIMTDGRIDGYMLQRLLLNEYNIQLELASKNRVLAIVTYADGKDGFDRFADALIALDKRIIAGENFDNRQTTQAESSYGKNRELYAPCIPGIE